MPARASQLKNLSKLRDRSRITAPRTSSSSARNRGYSLRSRKRSFAVAEAEQQNAEDDSGALTSDSDVEIVEEQEELVEAKSDTLMEESHIIAEDISGGKELFPVRVFNDSGETAVFPNFQYLSVLEDTVPIQRKPLVCYCKFYCNATCICVLEPFKKGEWRTAYREDKPGVLDQPSAWLKGGPDRLPRCIWECSKNCTCGPECFNRCVQYGTRFKFEIFWTGKEKRWGVRAKHDLDAGSFIAEYTGELKREQSKEYENIEDTMLHYELISVEKKAKKRSPKDLIYYIDASRKGNFTRFINHSCNPNAVAISVFFDDTDLDHGMHMGIFAIKSVKIDQEITLDYGEHFWTKRMEKGEYCLCGARNCKYRADKGQGSASTRTLRRK